MSQLSFQYRAIDPRGATSKGVLRAADQSEAYRQIVAAGLRPLRIQPTRDGTRRGKKIGMRDLAHLTHQLSVLLEARIPIVDGLRAIAEQESNPQLREVIFNISAQVTAGQTITEAITPHRALFGDVYIETLRAAEMSGNMIEVLAHMASMLERQYDMNKSVKGALMYPLCVISALTLAVTFLMIFVVPRFATLFENRGIELPVLTQVVMGVSTLLVTYWYLVLGLVGGGFWGIRRAWRTPTGRERIDNALHRVPVLRDILRGLAVSRFCHVLGVSLRSGLSLIDALDMAGRASGRPLLLNDSAKLREGVNLGRRLTDSLSGCEYLPPFARRMLAAGEEAAELPKMCQVVARHFDREMHHLTKNMATVIEPIMIVGLAIVVLIVALAIFLPMWNMASLLG